MFKLKRYYPVEMEVEISPQQIVSMFPIEIQEHPTMGIIERIWKAEDSVYSIKTIQDEFITDLSQGRIHKKVKTEKMLEILQNLDKFEILLYYEDKVDKYNVERI